METLKGGYPLNYDVETRVSTRTTSHGPSLPQSPGLVRWEGRASATTVLALRPETRVGRSDRGPRGHVSPEEDGEDEEVVEGCTLGVGDIDVGAGHSPVASRGRRAIAQVGAHTGRQEFPAQWTCCPTGDLTLSRPKFKVKTMGALNVQYLNGTRRCKDLESKE